MADGDRCLSCMYGTIVKGVCSHCGRKEIISSDRKADALPLKYLLHGRYSLGNVLGSGGFGITYAAWDRQNNHRVAVKELYPSKDVVRGPNGSEVRVVKGQEAYFAHVAECFRNEALLLSKLQGLKGVVNIYHLFEENGTVYYSMEYLDGVDLSTMLNLHGPLPWEQLSSIVMQIFPALDMLHRRNLIHRDISPDNIFLTKDSGVRLIDFGSVRTYQGEQSFTSFVKQNFAPWEQYQSHGKQGPWTDIYALSVTLYYSLSGVLPPKAPDRLQNTLPTRPLREVCANGLPAHVAGAIEKGMAVRMEDRFQNVRQYAQALFPGVQIPWMDKQPTEKQPTDTGQNTGSQKPHPSYQSGLFCCQGMLHGREWPLKRGISLRIGRQPYCEISYPLNAPGISGMQCIVSQDMNGRIMVRDENSRYGTWLNSTRMQGGVWYLAEKGMYISFAQERFLIQ